MHRLFDQHRDQLQVLAGVAAGATAAAVALVADAAVEMPVTIPTTNALSLLAATFSALVTAGAFAFWMLPLAAQLAAASVPPPLVAGQLHGRFQRRVITATLGALAYVAVAVAALPASAGTSSAPTITTAVGATLGVAAIAALLVAIEHAVRSTRPSVLVSQAAHAVIDHIRRSARGDVAHPIGEVAARRPATASVTAPSTGWLHAVDEEPLLRSVPEGTTVSLEVGLGAFVVEGWTTVATVRGQGLPADVERGLGGHFSVDVERAPEQALVGKLTQFTDIAVHAGSGSSGAPSIVYESIWYLGAILHELVHHDLGWTERQTDDGRVLEWSPEPDAATVANMAADRIRQVTASEPAMAVELVRVLVDVRHAARGNSRDDLVGVLDHQADLTVEQCRRGDPLPADLDRVIAARTEGPHADQGAERDEEYATEQPAHSRR